jgi:O-antigen ligase
MTEDDTVVQNLRRGSDHGWLCWVALRFTEFWDFVDKRDIDKQALVWTVYAMLLYSVYWGMEFVWLHPDQNGVDVAAKVAAITLPLTWVVAKITDWYFKARS